MLEGSLDRILNKFPEGNLEGIPEGNMEGIPEGNMEGTLELISKPQ